MRICAAYFCKTLQGITSLLSFSISARKFHISLMCSSTCTRVDWSLWQSCSCTSYNHPRNVFFLLIHIYIIVSAVITLADKDNNVLTEQASSTHKLFFLWFLCKHLRVQGIGSCCWTEVFRCLGYLTVNAPGMLHFPSTTSCN